MQIDSNKLTKFVKKATLNGSILDFLIKIENNKMIAINKDASNAAMASVSMPVTSDDVVIPIKDSRVILKTLNLFSGDVEVKVNNNILSIFNKTKQVDIVLTTEEYVNSKLPGLSEKLMGLFDAVVEVPSTPLKNTVKNAGVVNTNTCILELDKTDLLITAGEKTFDTIKETIPAQYPYDAKVKLGALLFEVSDVLGDKIKLSLKTDLPSKFAEQDGDIEAIYIIAPIVENK